MGVYDTVRVPCPQCGTLGYFQTKSGPCEMKEYDLADAPVDVMANVNRHAPWQCEECWTYFWVEPDDRSVVEFDCKNR
jgi:hypothetical protein